MRVILRTHEASMVLSPWPGQVAQVPAMTSLVEGESHSPSRPRQQPPPRSVLVLEQPGHFTIGHGTLAIGGSLSRYL